MAEVLAVETERKPQFKNNRFRDKISLSRLVQDGYVKEHLKWFWISFKVKIELAFAETLSFF